MPSRAYTSFLRHCCQVEISNRRNARVNALSGLYLISTVNEIYDGEDLELGVNALSGLYLISTSVGT